MRPAPRLRAEGRVRRPAGDRLCASSATPREVRVAGAHLVSTDVWASMGQRRRSRRAIFALFRPYQVNASVARWGRRRCTLFMPACRPTAARKSAKSCWTTRALGPAWDQAENRLHAQKALLELLDRTRPLRLSP
ncbi:hypothetical protein ACPA9J_16735 [Pseudomonas aeruginosa]